MADGPGRYGSGHEDLDRETAALDKIAPKVDAFNKRRAGEVEVTDRSTARLKSNTKALEENALALERQAEAVRKLSDAQARLLGQAATSGEVRARGGELNTARSLQRQGLLAGDTPVNGPFRPTDVGAIVAQQRGLIQTVAVAAASAMAVKAVVTPKQYESAIGPANRARREAVSREAIAAEEDAVRASRELASATRQEAASHLRNARAALAREGAAAGTLGIFPTGAGQGLRFGIREERTGQRVSGSFRSREAAEERIAALQAEVAPAVAENAQIQRQIGVTAGMELAVRQRIVAALVRYEAALNAEPVIPESRQIGHGGGLLPARHPLLFGQRDYGPRYGMYGGPGAVWEHGPDRYVPAGQNAAYDRWRQYYAGGGGGGGAYRGGGPTRPPAGPLALPMFSQSSLHEHAAAMESGSDSYVRRVAAADRATASMGRYADAERRAAEGTRFAAAEFGTADRSMYKHGALATEFIQAAYRGEVTMRDLGKQVALTVGKFGGWTIAASLVYGAARAIGTLGNGAMATNSAIAELHRYIGGLDTDRARKQLRGLSEDLNVDMDTAAKQFTAAARLTGNIHDPRKAQDTAASIAHTTLLLSRVGDLDPDTAMRYTQALQTGFRMSSDQLAMFIDQLNQLQNNMNIPFDVSAQATATAAGTWRAAGGSPENLAALVAAGRRGSGFSGQILGTTYSRAATMIGRPGNRKQLAAFGIDPDQTVDQIFEQAMKLVESHQVSGRDVIRLGTALSSPQLAGRGVVAALQNPAQYRRALKLEDPDTAKGSAQRELTQMLKSWREQIIAIANGLRQFGSALEESGFMAPLGLMLKTLNAISDVVQFLIGGFNDLLPPGLRQGVALLLEGAAAIAVMRRVGAFRSEGRLVQAFPQLAAFHSPEAQLKGLATRGARTQVEESERARESAARAYSTSRQTHEVLVREHGQMQADLRAAERRGVAPGTPEHARLSREITAREKEIEHAEAERATALRQTVIHQKVVQRSQAELRTIQGMTAAEAAIFARATGLPLPASLKIPEPRGAVTVPTAETPYPMHQYAAPIGPVRPGQQYAAPIGPLTRDDWVARESFNMGLGPRADVRTRFRNSAFGQRMARVRRAMADEIRSMEEGLRQAAGIGSYVYAPGGLSGWNKGQQQTGEWYGTDTSAAAMRQRAMRLSEEDASGRFGAGVSRAAYRGGQRLRGLAGSASDLARNSKVLSGAASVAERSLNAAVTGIEAGVTGLGRLRGGMSNLWRSLGVLDKVFLGIAAWQVAESLTQPAGDAIRRDYTATMRAGTGARDQKDRERLARRATEHVSGHDIDSVIVGGVGQILNPTQWDDIASGRDVGTLRRAAIDRRNAQSQNARIIVQMQRQAAAAGQPLPMRFSGDIARDARRLMAEQGTLTNQGDYAERMKKLQQEADMASLEGRNPRERHRSQQRLAQVMADLAASADDKIAVRRQLATLDEPALQKASQSALAEVSSYGLHGSRSRQYLMMAQEAYLAAVEKEGRGTPEQLAALGQSREQFFQSIAGAAQADLAIGLDAAGADPTKRGAAFKQERHDVYGQTVGVAKRSLADAQRRQRTLQGQRDQAAQAATDFASTGDTGMADRMRKRLKSLDARLEGVNVQVGKRSDEVELTERLFKAWDIDDKHRAYQDRQEGRQRAADLRASRTDDPVIQAREQTKRTRQDLQDARQKFGRNSPEAQTAETAYNTAVNNQFQAHLQDIQAQGRLNVAQGTRDTVGRARNTLAEARKALAYAEQHKKKHPTAYREALLAVDQAEESLDDSIQSRAESITSLEGQLAVAQAHGDPLVAAQQARRAANLLTRHPGESQREFALRRAVARQEAANQGQDATRDLHAARGEYRSSVSGDPRDQARAELENANQEVRDAQRGTAAWFRALAHRNNARRQLQQAENDMAAARLELARAGTDDPVKQARIDEQIARQAIKGTTGAERLRARARLREAHRNTLVASVQAREDTVDFNLAMDKITNDQAATQLESLAKSHGIGKSMRRQLLQRAHELRKESEQEASGFALDVGTIKLPTIYDVRRAMAPLRQARDMAAPRFHTNVSIGDVSIDSEGAADRFWQGMDRTLGSTTAAQMRSAGMRG